MATTILLTGGSGFIGRNILESDIAQQNRIFAPTHQELELMDENAVREYIRRYNIEIIIHAAAKPGHRNASDPTGIFYTNTRVFFNLARNSGIIKKMIVIGSGAIYDSRFYRPKMSESYYDTHVPLDEHGLSKYVIEKYIQQTGNIYDLRVFGIYGKYEDYSIRFISNMICKALLGFPLTVKMNRMFDYIYVDDLIPVLMHFIENEISYHAVNVTPDSSMALSDIASLVLDVLGKRLPIIVREKGLGVEYSGSNELLRMILPNLALLPLRKGIELLSEYYVSILPSIDVGLLREDK